MARDASDRTSIDTSERRPNRPSGQPRRAVRTQRPRRDASDREQRVTNTAEQVSSVVTTRPSHCWTAGSRLAGTLGRGWRGAELTPLARLGTLRPESVRLSRECAIGLCCLFFARNWTSLASAMGTHRSTGTDSIEPPTAAAGEPSRTSPLEAEVHRLRRAIGAVALIAAMGLVGGPAAGWFAAQQAANSVSGQVGPTGPAGRLAHRTPGARWRGRLRRRGRNRRCRSFYSENSLHPDASGDQCDVVRND